MDQHQIKNEMLKDNCDWIEFNFNAPHASHAGGVWERQIRTVRSVLAALLDQHGTQLEDEALRTFMIEAETIVNSRPLIVEDKNSPDYPYALSPRRLLTLKSKVVLPSPGTFQRADVYSKKRWWRDQYLLNESWDRWRKSYLQTMQTRQKWLKPRRNLMVGDIVLDVDNNVQRNCWKIARVSKTYPSEDGLVRRVAIAVADGTLDNAGKRIRHVSELDRPI